MFSKPVPSTHNNLCILVVGASEPVVEVNMGLMMIEDVLPCTQLAWRNIRLPTFLGLWIVFFLPSLP